MNYLSLNEFCKEISISEATAKNWVKLDKIKPDFVENSEMFFTKSYVQKLKKDILKGEKSYLKSRRNKKYISGNFLYKNYLSKSSKNTQIINNLLSKIDKLNKDEIQCLLADCALQLINENYNLSKFLETLKQVQGDKICCHSEFISESQKLIDDLISDRKMAQTFIENNPELFKTKYIYEKDEDILGLLYISLSNLGDRKSRGAYYTPTKVVKKLVKDLEVSGNIIDPCCGTGNFLLQLPKTIDISQIYGNDIDEISIKIARLNLFLKYRPINTDILYSNITNNNFLYNNKKYDCVIGNPPWGAEFSEKEKNCLRKNFTCAGWKNIESYDVFIEKSLNSLNLGGVLAFVLPEAILNVRTHKPIREVIKTKCKLKSLEFLGNVFDGVHCPSIILKLKYNNKPFSCVGAEIKDTQRSFVINKERNINSEQFDFYCNDEEYELLNKIFSGGRMYLKDNAEFALGIVTGNNKNLLSNVKTEENEVIIKGSDITKYAINPSSYIIFTPEKFQQVAPEKMYRAEEKLFYRFIGDKLVFAYDNKQRLSLNSCNILIPHIEGYDIKYIMAIFNSSVAQFVFSKKYNSIKVLRSHIENIPIPKCENQSEIIELVDKLLDNPHDAEIYNILDKKILELYGLDIKFFN